MQIQDQFNKISQDYDSKRKMFIPCFDEFYINTTDFICSSIKQPRMIVDLGAGTGLLTSFWYKYFPNSKYLLVDVAENMLNIAKQRFTGCNNINFKVIDYSKNLPVGEFNAFISALSIHHLNDHEKNKLFNNIYNNLYDNGIFINYDQFQASNQYFNNLFSKYWENKLLYSGLNNNDLTLWHERQILDKECSVNYQISMLKEQGFTHVECIYLCRKFAVIMAIK